MGCVETNDATGKRARLRRGGRSGRPPCRPPASGSRSRRIRRAGTCHRRAAQIRRGAWGHARARRQSRARRRRSGASFPARPLVDETLGTGDTVRQLVTGTRFVSRAGTFNTGRQRILHCGWRERHAYAGFSSVGGPLSVKRITQRRVGLYLQLTQGYTINLLPSGNQRENTK